MRTTIKKNVDNYGMTAGLITKENGLTIIVLLSAFVAFTLSASAGLGGSLILVPILVLLLGAKSGIALATLLLAANNVAKVFAYRKTIPLKQSAFVILLTIAGAFLGASALVVADSYWVQLAVVASIALTLVAERDNWRAFRRISAPVLAFLSGSTSGFSGTSGPLKGIALRSLNLQRQFLVGAASAVSLMGDMTKATVFINSDLMPPDTLWLFAAATTLMPFATLLGKRINQQIGERAYTGLFWAVMVGYTARLILT